MTTPSRLQKLPSWLLGQAGLRAQRALAHALASVDLRTHHYRVLMALAEGSASQADLGRAVELDRSDVVAVVNDLVERGSVRRKPDPADARRNQVSLTAAGRRLLVRVEKLSVAVQEELLADLSERERKNLVVLLTKLTS